MVSQMELDFSPKSGKSRRKEAGVRTNRPHHRTTTLTVPKESFLRISEMKDGDDPVRIEYVNDIISSGRGGNDEEHHEVRRTALLRSQYDGGFVKVDIRYCMALKLPCLMRSEPDGYDDACTGVVSVCRAF